MAEDETTSVASKHLSELCKIGSVNDVLRKLRSECDDDAAINWQDGDGRTAFHWAVGLRSWELATTLMGAPHDCALDTSDNDGCTPLMSACAVDAPDSVLDAIIQYYQSRSVDKLNASDSAGNSALILAASRGNVRAIRKLCLVAGNLGHQNHRGQTALHRAVSRGNTDAVEEILAVMKKMDRPAKLKILNCVDCEGNTALHYAALENNQELGQLLLRHGANRELANKQGKLFYEL